MKLRHKKPLNPYKGQANNDKNEFNDDDFRQQGSPHKKNGNVSSDQIFKYARILAKFVKTINQDYKHHQLSPDHLRPEASREHSLPKEKTDFDPQQLPAPFRKEQLKQQKQIAKLQPKIQSKQDNKEPKTQPKKKDNFTNASSHRENKFSQPDAAFPLDSAQKFNQSASKIRPESKTREVAKAPYEKVDPAKPVNENLGLAKPSIAKAPQGPQVLGLGLGGNPVTQMGNGNLLNLPQNLQGLQGMMGQNQMLNNLQMMGLSSTTNMSQMELAQLLMRYNNQGYFYGGFPTIGMNGMNMNMNMMGIGMQGNSPFMFPSPSMNIKPVPNLFNEQVNSFKSNPDKNSKDIKAVYPLKRSAYHVAIAYKIYLDKLKREGRSFETLQEIDPTKSARRIKSNQQQQAKNAALAKKKK